MILTHSFSFSFDSLSFLTSYCNCLTFHLVSSQLYRSHFTIKSVLTSLIFKRLTRWLASFATYCRSALRWSPWVSVTLIRVIPRSLHRLCAAPPAVVPFNPLVVSSRSKLSTTLLLHNMSAKWDTFRRDADWLIVISSPVTHSTLPQLNPFVQGLRLKPF